MWMQELLECDHCRQTSNNTFFLQRGGGVSGFLGMPHSIGVGGELLAFCWAGKGLLLTHLQGWGQEGKKKMTY